MRIKLLIPLIIFTYQTYSQISFGEAFLLGDYIEVGVSQCGSFGTSGFFQGSHPRNDYNSGIGFVADPDKDGWSTGVPNYYGDFFLPGSPVEGWAIQTISGSNTNFYMNSNTGSICGSNNIDGDITDYYNDQVLGAVWKSNPQEFSDLEICKEVSFDKQSLSFVVNTKITNTTTNSIDELYFARFVDADNDRALAGTNEVNNLSTYRTNNYLESNIGNQGAVVASKGILFPQTYLALGTRNTSAIASINQNEKIQLQGTNLKSIWNGTHINYSGVSNQTDAQIILVFKFTDIAPGETIEFSYAYVLALSELDKALNNTTNEFTFSYNGSELGSDNTADVVDGTLGLLEVSGNPSYSWTWESSAFQNIRDGFRQEIFVEGETVIEATGVNSRGCNNDTVRYTIILNGIPPKDCEECIPSFSPVPGEKYTISAWVKEDSLGLSTYDNPAIILDFENADDIGPIKASGPIIDGWQRIEVSFTVPAAATAINVRLKNMGGNPVYFDDIRIHPFNSNMKSFVYDPQTLRLHAELDENNYATFYEYDEEGALVRVKKETERGTETINETRQNLSKQR